MSRRRTKDRESYWRGVIAGQQASGLSIAAFCREEDVSPPSFYAWRRRLAKQPTPLHPAAKQPTPQFVPVSLPATAAEFELRLPNGVSVVVPGGFAEASLGRLLQVVGQWERSGA
jgi:hypothetical protein